MKDDVVPSAECEPIQIDTSAAKTLLERLDEALGNGELAVTLNSPQGVNSDG